MKDRLSLEDRLQLSDIDTCILTYGVVAFGLILRECEKVFKDFGLSTGEFTVLMHLRAIDKEANLSQVKNNVLLFSGASITKIAEKLHGKKYITRRENPNSRREKLVRITAKGKRIAGELLNGTQGLHGIILANIKTDKKAQLLDCLKTLLSNVTMDDCR